MARNALPAAVYGAAAMAVVAALVTWLVTPSSRQADMSASWEPGWRVISHFQIPRRAFTAAADDGYLYVIGGVDAHNRYVAQVEYAPILDDGRLGPWQFTSPLGEARFYLAAVSSGGYVYALGGASGPLGDDNVPSARVERAQLLAGGGLGPWQDAGYLTTPRRGLMAVAVDSRLFALGGYNGQFLKSVESTNVGSDGSLEPWALEPSANLDRYIHSAASTGSRIYLLAGHVQRDSQLSYGNVESAQVSADGHLSGWRLQQARLAEPRFIAAAAATEGAIVIAGGHDGSQRLASVETARIGAGGRTGPWRQGPPLERARSGAAAVAYGGTVYILGGIGDSGVRNDVEAARIGPDGGLGWPAR